MPKMETKKQTERESGTRKDVELDGRHEKMRYSHHEMGSYGEGSDHHDCHRKKGD